MISTPQDKKRLMDAIKEMSDSMTRCDAEKDLQKEIVADVAEELELKKQYVNKLARLYHKQNFVKVQTEHEEIEELYEELFGAGE